MFFASDLTSERKAWPWARGPGFLFLREDMGV